MSQLLSGQRHLFGCSLNGQNRLLLFSLKCYFRLASPKPLSTVRCWRPTTGIVHVGKRAVGATRLDKGTHLVDLFWFSLLKGLMVIGRLCSFRLNATSGLLASSKPLESDAGGQRSELCRLARRCCSAAIHGLFCSDESVSRTG